MPPSEMQTQESSGSQQATGSFLQQEQETVYFQQEQGGGGFQTCQEIQDFLLGLKIEDCLQTREAGGPHSTVQS